MTRTQIAAGLFLASLATIIGAYIFEYGFDLAPCELCLKQRIPYYVGIPIAGLAAIVAQSRPSIARLLLIAFALAMLIGAGLGIYHAGVEWKFWEGPTACTSGADNVSGVTDVLKAMREQAVVRCDEAAWRFLGLSLAGYNVLISLALAAIAWWGAAKAKA
ncbi:MAG: disulfide bond formation protein B [Rhodobiaceae bacterium]|nr:disulfide bond formation protein B [Rhodobiaceae bacterium]MCC0056866.1 disulfide bond formation protein B [Rhodobiaceae bacterium]